MADSDNFKDIFAAIDEINLPKEKKKKKLEESKSIDQEKVSKPKSPNKNETIPLSTEELIKQAEKQLKPTKKKYSPNLEKPKRTTKNPKKPHIVVAKEDDKIKTIRFGQKGAKTAGKPKAGESARMKAKRKSFKARHAKNIAKGKMSAAYWADKVKW